MGWIKDAKANAIAQEAARAREEGRTVFVARINNPATGHVMSGSVAGVAEQIEAVEAQGWLLHQMSYCQDKRGGVEGYYLFRPRR
ncbi:hypothetical protein ABZ671_26960 [Micromonospora sp. NPDC006766]|uniref:hypothetical protein n=1 Tax=Micromonospora sp. NPDC006766 TaxID=3154778 RepID=UPI0034103B76